MKILIEGKGDHVRGRVRKSSIVVEPKGCCFKPNDP
jgi:hypothetical protein